MHRFDSAGVAVERGPLPHPHVAVPAPCSTMEFPRHPRRRTDLPAIVHRGDLATVGATIESMASGGCRAGARESPGEEDDRLALHSLVQAERRRS